MGLIRSTPTAHRSGLMVLFPSNGSIASIDSFPNYGSIPLVDSLKFCGSHSVGLVLFVSDDSLPAEKVATVTGSVPHNTVDSPHREARVRNHYYPEKPVHSI